MSTPTRQRRLPRQFTPDSITGTIPGHTTTAPAFHVYGAASPQHVGSGPGRPGWLTAWGYLATDGTYGCGRYPQFTGQAGDPGLDAELRAVWNAVQHPISHGPLTVVTRTTAAADQLNAWHSGSTDLPPGYTGSARRPPTLERLRRAITAHPDNITIQAGTAGPLTGGAQALTDLAGWWAREDRDKAAVQHRAGELAMAFLTTWRRQ